LNKCDFRVVIATDIILRHKDQHNSETPFPSEIHPRRAPKVARRIASLRKRRNRGDDAKVPGACDRLCRFVYVDAE
jgi:hypothetical protein